MSGFGASSDSQLLGICVTGLRSAIPEQREHGMRGSQFPERDPTPGNAAEARLEAPKAGARLPHLAKREAP